jgi:hypothetical protein
VDGKSLEIDSRPSDAIALAVRVQVPIFAEESVLEKAGVMLDKEGEAAAAGEGTSEPLTTPNAEELEKLSPFREFIESLPVEPLTFGEDGKQSPYVAFTKFLEDLPKFIELGKGAETKGELKPGGDAKFIEGSEELRDRAKQIVAEKKIEFGAALKLARAEAKARVAA